MSDTVKPIILAVDDEPDVLRAVVRDLRSQYGKDYRIARAESGQEALELLQECKRKGTPVALLVSDQRMPGMTGTAFIEHAKTLFPTARRILLTAYADTGVAIQAINELGLDYYLMKPWNPPQDKLYPVIDEQLYSWRKDHQSEFDGVKIIDHRWSFDGHSVRDFVARNHMPYRWIDVESSAAKEPLLAAIDVTQGLPIVVMPDGTALYKPSLGDVAERIGLATQATVPFYDVIVIGAGPAGLAVAVTASTERIKTAVIERSAPGGQAGTSSLIENYLGFPAGISGAELSRRALDQARRFGAEFISARDAVSMRVEGQYRFVRLSNGDELSCHCLIIANGVTYNRLTIPGCRELEGLGVFYGAATTEALSCENKAVFIIGAGNSAGQAAMMLSQYARQVTIVCRRGSIRETMSEYLAERIDAADNITVLHRTQPVGVVGAEHLTALTVRNLNSNDEITHPADAMFVFIGATPHTEWVSSEIIRDERGFVVTGTDLKRPTYRQSWLLARDPYLTETSVPGVFAVGDVRHGSTKRVAAAVGEGSITQRFISEYLSGL
ncbi:MAG: FAD-dependent oxidoreductase [Candidatus Competibacteraceae bacterium]|nr:FAD-dependent oxidoreductase [Candidatus Competibacteraceae bacterium]